jgi:circadian clock protein KaiC
MSQVDAATAALTPLCPTGIEGFDEVLCGGLPRNRLYLVQGTPGVGKTTLALQFLLNGIAGGETVLYITLSETKEELIEVARAHGWDLSSINLFELSALEERLKGEVDTTFFHPSEIELQRTTQAFLSEVERVKPSRVVFDSLSEMRMLAETPLRYRRQILQLKQFFAGRKCTVLLLDDGSSSDRDLQIESLAHGVVELCRSNTDYGVPRRQLNVQKVRGLKYREGYHDFTLRTGGLEVFPRLVAADHRGAFEPTAFKSGIPQLDQLLGGGLDRGTTTMFMGQPGTGKSTLALKFCYEAATNGEKVLFFTFDETLVILNARMKALGMDFAPLLAKGAIEIVQVDPAEISPGELSSRIQLAVVKKNVRVIAIDSINGYMNAMPEERYLQLQLHELLGFLNQRAVMTLMVLAQQGAIPGITQSYVDLTYLSDTVVLLRYFEARGSVHQAISVIKKRSGNHERTIREIRVTPQGIAVGEPLTNFHGVLTGTPTFTDDTLYGGEDSRCNA